MINFLKRPTNDTLISIDDLTQQLCDAIKIQYLNDNITAVDIQKIIQLANNTVKLRAALACL